MSTVSIGAQIHNTATLILFSLPFKIFKMSDVSFVFVEIMTQFGTNQSLLFWFVYVVEKRIKLILMERFEFEAMGMRGTESKYSYNIFHRISMSNFTFKCIFVTVYYNFEIIFSSSSN